MNGDLETKGWVIYESMIRPSLIERLKNDLREAWYCCQAIQERNGVADDADLTVHHVLAVPGCDSFFDLLEAMQVLDPLLRDYFGGKYILNSMGGAINMPEHTSYAQRIHRDIRTYTRDHLMLNTLVMLDDFTADNGATWLYPRSDIPFAPGEDRFINLAEQAIAPAGSVLVFDSNVWHRGGENTTNGPRRSITPLYSKPFFKQGLDYPRALAGLEYELSEYQKQIIGYNARVPANLNEWYQPEERRAYRKDQG